MVEVEQLVKRYRSANKNALDGVTFSVASGEFFALLGPNGAGKSTAISILTTTLSPTSGIVRIGGLDISHDPASVRKQVGIIFQNPSLDMNLSGEENIRLHAILYGLYPYRPSYRMMPADYRKRVADIASVLGMEKDMQQPVRKLSGGMRRKLEIMRSLMHHPQVLFLDEPTTGLDVASRRSLWAYLTEIRQRHEMTIVLTTHYLEEAEGAERILILNHGQIVALGAPAQVKAQLAGNTLTLDADDRAALRNELARLGASFEGDGPFRLALDGRSAHELVRTMATPLTLMQTQQASLEDVYLRILAGGEHD